MKSLQKVNVALVSLGWNHAGCVTRANGFVLMWGKNIHGCLGDGTCTHQRLPDPSKPVHVCVSSHQKQYQKQQQQQQQPVVPLCAVTQLECGEDATMCIEGMVGGKLWAWGLNVNGQVRG